MPNSPSTRDEDNNSKWGSGGKTAKMVAAQWCSDNGYYSNRIVDDRNWYFHAECSESVPSDWSRAFSDEAAKEKGFSNRNDAARDDCKKKGFKDIDPNQWRDKGEWTYSLKCTGTNTSTNGGKNYCETCSPSTRDEDNNSKWGSGGKTAKLVAAQWCSDNGYYSHRIVDDGNWYFHAECSESVPSDWSRPFLDEAAREKGFSNRNDAAKDDCKKKGFTSVDSNSWRDKGEWHYSLRCTPYVIDGYTDAQCQTSTTLQIPGHHWWGKLAVGDQDWGKSADDFAKKLKIPDTQVESQNVIDALGRKDFTGAYIDVWTSDPSCDVKWDTPVTGCDGAGHELTIQKCNSWVGSKDLPGGDVISCLNSPSKPDVKKWIACGIGSSPGGIAPGDGATACSPLSSGPKDFSCKWGQNCFAVTAIKDDANKCPNSFFSNPLGSISDMFSSLKMYSMICCIILVLSSLIVIMFKISDM